MRCLSRACISFGGSLLIACGLSAQAAGKPSEKPFALVPGSFHFSVDSDEAGAHSDWTTSFDIGHNSAGETVNDLRNVTVNFPAGFDASSTAAPTCSESQLATPRAIAGYPGVLFTSCPIASQIGVMRFSLSGLASERGLRKVQVPLFNMEVTAHGVAAELGFNLAGALSQILTVHVRPGDTGLTVSAANIVGTDEPHEVSVTAWGVPAAHEHDAERGYECVAGGTSTCGGGGQEANIPPRPFLSNPTSCGMFTATVEADSWEHSEEWSSQSTEVGPIGECERVRFAPSLEVQPSTRSAESATGLNVTLGVPQTWESAETLATANLEGARVALPEGMTVNPSAGSGLAGCAPGQYAAETAQYEAGVGCPPESKIGSILIETPLLAETIPGAIYIAQPYDNPFSEPAHPNGSLLALYVVAKDPQKGILIEVPGKLEANPVTGQLVSTFSDDPQQPFSRFTLKFRPGATAPLVSPPTCGAYATDAALTPWSNLNEPQLITSQPFQITSGIQEGPCPAGGVPPFDPTVISGTQNNAAGSFSPFYLRIERKDGEQEITKFSTTMPPGLSGDLTGIPFCPDTDIEAARHVSGAQEEAAPSCPAASQIGRSITEAGVGTVLAQTPGELYLAGPYHGAPLSLVSITSAKVGPFDLGTVVIRFALDINPSTAQVEVSGSQSEAIPHIIDGIVVHVRDIRAYVDREHFILDPTSCAPMRIEEAITGAGANPADPADQDTVPAGARFQAADCASLAFKPIFKTSTQARTSRTNGASLHVSLSYPPGSLGKESNIHEVRVELPKQLPSRLTTLQKACTDAVFNANPAACPAASIVGSAKAITPILPEPLRGPAYFVSHGGAKFPELIIVLSGYGFTIDLHGETFVSKAGVTSSTFATIPDQPVESFELTLPEGPDSALAANGDLCAEKLVMPTSFVAQNGAALEQRTAISVQGCKPQIRVLRHSVNGGHATVVVSVPSAGMLVVDGGGVHRSARRVARAGTVTLTLRLSKGEQRFVAHHRGRRLKVPLELSFAPAHGRQLSARVAVLMR